MLMSMLFHKARRLYVGNLPQRHMREDQILGFFNAAMLKAGKTGVNGNQPVVSVNLNNDKGFCFLEFEHSKICSECLAFDGIILEGNTLKLRRPKDYMPLPENFIEEPELGPNRGHGE